MVAREATYFYRRTRYRRFPFYSSYVYRANRTLPAVGMSPPPSSTSLIRRKPVPRMPRPYNTSAAKIGVHSRCVLSAARSLAEPTDLVRKTSVSPSVRTGRARLGRPPEMRSSVIFSLTGRRSEPIVRKTKGRNFVLAASVSLVDRLGFTFQASGKEWPSAPPGSLDGFLFFLRFLNREVETFRVRNDRRQQINCTRIGPDRYRRKAGTRQFSHRHYSLQHAEITIVF